MHIMKVGEIHEWVTYICLCRNINSSQQSSLVISDCRRCRPVISMCDSFNTLCLSVSMAIFPGKPGVAGFIEAKDDRSGGDDWSYMLCKAPSQIITNKPTSNFFTGRMPFLSPNQQCQSVEGKISHFTDFLTASSPGVFQPCLWPLTAPGYLGAGLPCLSSALWCQYLVVQYCGKRLKNSVVPPFVLQWYCTSLSLSHLM